MTIRSLIGDCRIILPTLADQSAHCVVTSPPYFGLRDYGIDSQIGLEPTPQQYIDKLVSVFREVRRVLRDDGTLWLNLGDSYAGGGNYRGLTSEGTLTDKQRSNRGATGISQVLGARGKDMEGLKPKDLIGIPWRVAFALQADGWYLRQDIIWSKPNPMPESVTDRCTKAHEYIFLLSKNARYYYDAESIKEPNSSRSEWAFKETATRKSDSKVDLSRDDINRLRIGQKNGWVDESGRNKRSVWEIATQPYSEAHFATFPPALIEPCIKAGCPKDGTVLDPFGGAGTTGMVADRLGRNAVMIELNPAYAQMAEYRIKDDAGMFADII